MEVRRHEDAARRGAGSPYRAAVSADRVLPSADETAIAKAYCNRAGFEVANEALQVMGAMGYSQEKLVECFPQWPGK